MSEGYQKFAEFMVEKDYPILKKFEHVAFRDLLYRQAELVALEAEHTDISNHNMTMEGEHGLYDGNWEILSTSAARSAGGEQWQKVLEIREKLWEYYACMSQYREISSKPNPRKRDVSVVLDWVQRPDLGGGLVFSGSDLCPLDSSVYRSGHPSDLMILSDRLGENDAFTRLLAGPIFHGVEKLLRYFKKPLLSDPENQASLPSNLFEYSDNRIIGIINILGTILASMAPLLSIIVLHFVGDLEARLVVVCVCTFFFSGILAFVTKARRVEIFAATAAFASVQVVFIGSVDSNQT